MSGTQAKINRLRLIRRKMQQEIKEIEVAVAEKERGRRSHAKQDREIPSTRVSQKALDAVRISRNRDEGTSQRPAATRQTKPTIDQEFNLYLLTRNLILATSNRQMKRAFRVWRKKLEAKRKAAPKRVTNIPPPPKRRAVKQAPKPAEVHVLPYAFKPRDEKRKVDREMLTAAYERVGQVDESEDSDYDMEELVWQLRGNENDGFTFTPEPAEAPQRQVRESPVAGNARAVVNAQPKKQVSMIRESGSSDIGEFIELENEVDDTSSKSTERVDSESESESLVKEAPVPSAYPDELVKMDVEEGSMMTASVLGAKQKEDTDEEEDVVDGYIEESFSRETSPKSIVKKNFSGSLKDKLEDAVTSFSKSLPSPSPRKSPAQREMLSSGSPRRATPTSRAFASTSPVMRQSESFGTPRRSAMRDLEDADVQLSRRSFGKSSPSPSRNQQSFELQSLERTTPRSIRKSPLTVQPQTSAGSSRFVASKSPVRVLHSSDEEIVKEVPSPYSVKQGAYLSKLLSQEPKETFHINDDGAAAEEPTEYSVRKRSSPSPSLMSSSSNVAWARNPDASDDSSDETEVAKETSFDSSLHAPRAGRELTYIAASSSDSEDFQGKQAPTRPPAHRKLIQSDDYEEELDDELYEEFVNMKISSSSSGEA